MKPLKPVEKVGHLNRLSYAKDVGAAPGEFKNQPDPSAAPEFKGPPGKKKRYDLHRLEEFMFPKMPGAFRRWEVKGLPVEERRARYLKVLGASAGSHQIALFYAVWTEEEYQVHLADPTFREKVVAELEKVADRAAFMWVRAMGAIRNKAGEIPKELPGLEAAAKLDALAKRMRDKADRIADSQPIEPQAPGGILKIEGLD